MIVAVLAVRMMEMSAHQVIDMIAMRHCLVAAVWSVDMAGFVRAAVVARSAVGRIGSADCESVVINMAVVNMMHVSIMQIIRVAVVLDGGVAAILAVGVCMTFVFHARCGHNVLPLSQPSCSL